MVVLAGRPPRRASLGWKITAEQGGVDERIDEAAIARALAGLRIAAITEYLKAGGFIAYTQMPHRDGRGVATVVRLPLGVNAERIVIRRSDLAAGLFRSSREVWPAVGESADLLDLWVADRGALAETHSPEIAQLLIDIAKLGRKRGIHLVVSTQAPTRDSMPRDVTRNCSNGIAFVVGDHGANDALLGQGAYAAGHRAPSGCRAPTGERRS